MLAAIEATEAEKLAEAAKAKALLAKVQEAETRRAAKIASWQPLSI